MLKSYLLLVALLGLAMVSYCQIPTIQNFAPDKGHIGSTVVISGTNFSTVPAENHVFFGQARANVISATANSIEVKVPKSATFERLSVAVNGKVAYAKPFRVTFTGLSLDETTFSGPGSPFAIGDDSWALASGDLDLDGKIDIASANYASNNISVLRNTGNGAGNFSYEREDFSIGLYSGAITIGDVDGDGKLDIVTGSYVGSVPTLSVFHNISTGPGDINFTKHDFSTAHGPVGLAIGDIDGDGKPDISITCYSVNGVAIHLNTGGPGNISFTHATTVTVGEFNTSIAIADLNADGKLDLVTANDTNPEGISVLQNTTTVAGSPSFTKTIYAAGFPFSIAISDIDGDDKPDLVASNEFGHYLSIYLNTSTSSGVEFGEQIKITMSSPTRELFLNDLDGDAKIDVVVKTSGSLAVLPNTSTGIGTVSFGPKLEISVNGATSVSDQDGDGKPELIIVPGAGSYGNTLTVLRNNISGKIDQTISFTPLANKKFGDNPFQLSASASSDLPVSYATSDATKATIANGLVTIVGVGSVTITASQAGDEEFNEAMSVSRDLIISKADQSISFAPLVSKKFGDSPFQLLASVSSGLPVSFTISDLTKATIVDGLVTIVGAGSVIITARQQGSELFNEAVAVSQELIISKANQSISFAPIGPKTQGEASFHLTATTSSGLPVQLVASSNKVNLNGSEVSIIAPGAVRIDAFQPGDNNFSEASVISQSFCVNPKRPAITEFKLEGGEVLLISNTEIGNQWYRNGVQIPGEVSATYRTSESGSFSVRVKIDTCVSAFSEAQVVIITGIEEDNGAGDLLVYPTVSQESITISFPVLDNNEIAIVSITDTKGRDVQRLILENEPKTIDVSFFAPGVYFVSAIRNKKRFTSRFLR